MPVYHVSVSGERFESFQDSSAVMPENSRASAKQVLIVGVNWLGDSIMTMPAIQGYRRANPNGRIVMLVKPKCRDVWSMHADVDSVLVCPDTALGAVRAVNIVRHHDFGTAFILPHSFRSATVPFLARIPNRVGLPGHSRDWMLTKVVEPVLNADRIHQSYEYMNLFGLHGASPDHPVLKVKQEFIARMRHVIGESEAVKIGILPGAAYGPSKQWPADFFAETGRMLSGLLKCTVLIHGSMSERELCGYVASSIGKSAINLAGRTSLQDLAASLSSCLVVISNDSGGMHLAAALGIPVVAIFGITDPAKTGPLGKRVCILQDSNVRTRDLGGKSELAMKSLCRISPQQAFDAVRKLIGV